MTKTSARQDDLYSDLLKDESEEEADVTMRQQNEKLKKINSKLIRENDNLLKRVARVASINSKLRHKNLEMERNVCSLFKTAVLVRSIFGWRRISRICGLFFLLLGGCTQGQRHSLP